MRRSVVLASLVATLALAPAIAGDTKEGPGWKLSKGDKLRYGITYNLELKLEVMGMAQNVRQDARMEITEEVKDVSKDGVATIEATLERIEISVELPAMMGGGGKIQYDTAEKEDAKKDEKKKKDDDEDEDAPRPGMGLGMAKDAFKGLKDVVGDKFKFKLARSGAITDLEGVDAIGKKASAKLGGMAGGMMPGGASGQVFPLFDGEVLEQTLELHCHVFPSEEAGESWKIPTKIQVPSLGTMEFKRTITPKGEDKLQHAASKPEFKPSKVANPMMAQLGKPKISNPAYEGSSTWSKEKGRITGDELVATLTSEFSVDPNKMGGGGGGDDEDEDEAPKDKDKKKDDKKDDKKKKEDDDEDEDGGKPGKGGGMKMKIVQKYKLTMKYDLLTGAAPASDKKDEKKEEKKDKDF